MVLSSSSKTPHFTDESTRFSLSIPSTALGIFVAHVIFTYFNSESTLDVATTIVPPQVPPTTMPHLKIHIKATKGILPIIHLRSHESKETEGNWENLEKLVPQPKVWVVTPTYRRDDQFMSLTRTFQALYPARHFINWVIVDQMERSTERQFERLRKILRRFSISTRLIRSQPRQKHKKGIKGVEGRRAAVEYLRSLPPEVAGRSDVVFFADDDNVYDSDLFRQIRQTETVSMWPAGALDQYYLITPVLGNNGKILTVFGSWNGGRKYPVDFAQFSISLQLLRERTNVTIPYAHSQMENVFLEQLGVPLALVKPLGFRCLKIMTWHTKHHVNQGQRSQRIQIINLVRSNALLNSTNLVRFFRFDK